VAGRIKEIKTQMIPSGIEPMTLRLVGQCLNQARHRAPGFCGCATSSHSHGIPTCAPEAQTLRAMLWYEIHWLKTRYDKKFDFQFAYRIVFNDQCIPSRVAQHNDAPLTAAASHTLQISKLDHELNDSRPKQGWSVRQGCQSVLAFAKLCNESRVSSNAGNFPTEDLIASKRLSTCLYGARSDVVVKALRYKPAGRGFDSRWCHWNFSVT